MTQTVRSAVAAASIAFSGLMGSTLPVQAYQVDCAILICLAGGWPASAPCAHARAVFIRRITPWPIEPPLQIWRCPMGAAFEVPATPAPLEWLQDVAFQKYSQNNVPTVSSPLLPVQTDARADVDISGNAFDFVRSIRVYHIEFSQHENDKGNCITYDATRLGSYGVQGDYGWTSSSAAQVPPASGFSAPRHCSSVTYRSVFVDWRDHAGNYGFEEVRY